MRFSRAFLVTFLSREIALVFSFLNAVVLARGLGTESLGTYSLVVASANLLAQAGALGLNYSNNYLSARDPSTAGKLFAQSFLPALLLVPPATLLALKFPGFVRWSIGVLPEGYPWMACVGTGLIILNLNLVSLLLGLKEFKAQAFVSAVGPVGMGLSNSLAVGCFGGGAEVALRVWLAWNLAMVLAGSACLWRRSRPDLSFDGKLFRQSITVGFRALLTTVFNFMAQRGTLLLIDRRMGRASVGAYAVVLPLAETLQHIPATLGALLFTGASAQEDTRPQVARLLRIHLVLTAGAALGLALAAPILLPLLFGAKYGSSVLPFQILLLGYYFMGIWTLCASDLAGRYGYPGSVIGLTGLFAAITLILGYWWSATLGLSGVAWAWSTAAAVTSLSILAILWGDSKGTLGWAQLLPRWDDFRAAWRALAGRSNPESAG